MPTKIPRNDGTESNPAYQFWWRMLNQLHRLTGYFERIADFK